MVGRTEKGESTKRELLAVAAEVFARHGYAGTRMDDVIAASGMTKGAIYFHFGSKEELARAVVSEAEERWLALGRETVARHADPLEQFRSAGALLVDLMTGSWNVVRLASEIRRLTGTDTAGRSDQGPMAGWVALVAEVIEAGQLAGTFDPRWSKTDGALLLVAAFDGLKTVSDVSDDSDGAEFRRLAVQLLHAAEELLTSAPPPEPVGAAAIPAHR